MVDRSSWTSSVGVVTFPLEVIFVVVVGPIVWPFFSAIFISPVKASRLLPVIAIPERGSFMSSRFKPNSFFVHLLPKGYRSWSSICLGLYLIYPISSISGSPRFVPFIITFICVMSEAVGVGALFHMTLLHVVSFILASPTNDARSEFLASQSQSFYLHPESLHVFFRIFI